MSKQPPTDDPAPADAPPAAARERIAKVIARAGLASRRDAELMVAAGRVGLNGARVTAPGTTVGPDDTVTVDGQPLPARERTRLWLYHKPAGIVTTAKDPEGRRTVFEVLPSDLPRVVSVGRLDINTEGLLLLTNDGGLARVLAHPDTAWLRRYRVRAFGNVVPDALERLAAGIEIDGFHYGAIEARIDRQQGDNVWLTLGLREGKNREVKRVMDHLGLSVNRLIRLSFGPFQLGELAEGAIEEVRTRILRDQLGERLATDAGVDFDAPLVERMPARPGPTAGHRPGRGTADEARPHIRAGQVQDRKGRRVLVERVVTEPERPARPPKPAARPSNGPRPRPKSGAGPRPFRAGGEDREGPPRRGRGGVRDDSGRPSPSAGRPPHSPSGDRDERRPSPRPAPRGIGQDGTRPRFSRAAKPRPEEEPQRDRGADRPRGRTSDRPPARGPRAPRGTDATSPKAGGRPPRSGDRPSGGYGKPGFEPRRPGGAGKPAFGHGRSDRADRPAGDRPQRPAGKPRPGGFGKPAGNRPQGRPGGRPGGGGGGPGRPRPGGAGPGGRGRPRG
jgi:23S rRNA pseudouridine2605 synthase